MNRRSPYVIVATALVVLISACADISLSEPEVAPTTSVAPTTTSTTILATTIATTTTSTLPPVDMEAVLGGWEVSLRSVGPYQIGMTIAEAELAGEYDLVEAAHQDPSCSFYTHDPATGLDQELRFMVRASRIVRIDIDGPRLKTISGVGNGSTKGDLTSTYGNGVIVSTSHTGNASDSYVTYIPFDAGDADFRIRFETTDDIVTTFRIGQVPEVEWVNRCV